MVDAILLNPQWVIVVTVAISIATFNVVQPKWWKAKRETARWGWAVGVGLLAWLVLSSIVAVIPTT